MEWVELTEPQRDAVKNAIASALRERPEFKGLTPERVGRYLDCVVGGLTLDDFTFDERDAIDTLARNAKTLDGLGIEFTPVVGKAPVDPEATKPSFLRTRLATRSKKRGWDDEPSDGVGLLRRRRAPMPPPNPPNPPAAHPAPPTTPVVPAPTESPGAGGETNHEVVIGAPVAPAIPAASSSVANSDDLPVPVPLPPVPTAAGDSSDLWVERLGDHETVESAPTPAPIELPVRTPVPPSNGHGNGFAKAEVASKLATEGWALLRAREPLRSVGRSDLVEPAIRDWLERATAFRLDHIADSLSKN